MKRNYDIPKRIYFQFISQVKNFQPDLIFDKLYIQSQFHIRVINNINCN